LTCYWGGFLAADGCLGNYEGRSKRLQIRLSSVDRIHLQRFCECIEFTGNIIDSVDKYGYESSHIIISGTDNIAMQLGKLFNIIPNKTYVLNPPNIKEDRHIWSYLIGLIDGDGSIKFNKKRPKISNEYLTLEFVGTFSLMSWVKKFIELRFSHLGTRKISQSSSNTVYTYSLSGNPALEVIDYLYGNFSVPKLNRKWSKRYLINKKRL
jgi:hypothetical protein